jgi:hypothetical protein
MLQINSVLQCRPQRLVQSLYGVIKMQISTFNYKKSATLTYTLRDGQAPLTEEQFDNLVECFFEATDAAGFIHGHFHMNFDGKKTLKLTLPYSDAVGGEITAGMAVGHFIGQVDSDKSIDFWAVETRTTRFNPNLEYIPMLLEDA